MAITIVRLGSPRKPDEGLRLGTVRRPPRGVPKSDFAKRDFYDVWLPNLAPSEPLLKQALQAHQQDAEQQARAWKAFERKFRAEMKQPDASRLLDACRALAPNQFFPRLLLRGRKFLPPLGPAQDADGGWRRSPVGARFPVLLKLYLEPDEAHI